MNKDTGNINSDTRRRELILIADDELISRELLGNMLGDEYNVIFASNGSEALEKMEQYKDELSLVLLDLVMPNLSGTEVLKIKGENPEIQHIPVIVMTSDEMAEVECLNLGASDFITKPYPRLEVMLARIRRTIELYEDTLTIKSTERDKFTELYNRSYFNRYIGEMDRFNPDTRMDAVVISFYKFHILSERFGQELADKVLKSMSSHLRDEVHAMGGIICRKDLDGFLIYMPHGNDYERLLKTAGDAIDGIPEVADGHIRLRLGVYACVDKSLAIDRRFERARLALDWNPNNMTGSIEVYDASIHEKELFNEQLIDDFDAAIKEKQFIVYYQPKYNIKGEKDFLASAEALVRWIHPKYGMVSPGAFIPVFESNGLIHRLDIYVWTETARQIKEWKEKLGFTVPVSVNVSRVDMYDPNLISMFREILKENGLTTEELILEITESSYTKDSNQIIETVTDLRSLGFKVEMDDFGTGYSSLSMLSAMPIDALKLDMQFVRSAFGEKRDTRMIEIIIDIAAYLSVPVIAEGVETKEQLEALREIGCDVVQGYYFSKPIPAKDFEQFLKERKA